MKTKKLTCLALATMMMGATACGIAVEDDPNKTYINIAYFNGGVVVDWLEELEKEYEATHPDVDIVINSSLKEELKNQNLYSGIEYRTEDIFFTHTIDWKNFAVSGKIAELTDIMSAPATTGEVPIKEKMHDEFVQTYTDSNGKMFAIPFYENFSGAIYDVDLFEQKGLYLKEGGGYTSWNEATKTVVGTKSKGKDGVANTYDDGLPATFAEFKEWLSYMKYTKSVTPFIWNKDDSYRMNFYRAVHAGYEGLDNYALNTTFSGTDSALGEITQDNATKLLDQKGKQYALEMTEFIMDNTYYDVESMNGVISHLQAQEKFLRSTPDNKPIAMIFEGGWWEHEAMKVFESLAKRDSSYAFGKRRFAYLPIPKYDANHADGEVYISTGGTTTAIVNPKTESMDVVKDFLKYTLTDHGLSTFTRYTGLARPFEYELEDGVYEALTPFAKSAWDLYRNPNTKTTGSIVSTNEFREANPDYFMYFTSYASITGDKKAFDPFIAFYNNKSLTVADYLAGAKEFYKGYGETLANWKANN
jgi:ABC-type glycerol-3-phosphate transport system substrate-binding protein